jgi:hypothetical protein
MTRADRPGIVPQAVEVAYSVLILAWYVLPFIIASEGLYSVLLMPFHLYGGPPALLGALILTSVMACLVPIVCLFKIAAIFLDRHMPSLAVSTQTVPVILNILNSAFVTGLIVIHMIVFARNGHYFQAFSSFTYLVLLMSACSNAYFISLLIANVNRRDSAYGEYLEFRRTDEGRTSVFSILTTPGIQRKLIAHQNIIAIGTGVTGQVVSGRSNTATKTTAGRDGVRPPAAFTVLKENMNDEASAVFLGRIDRLESRKSRPAPDPDKRFGGCV